MQKNMSTPRSQRIGIWIIAIVMVVGTIGSFFVLILANKNTQTDQQNQAKLLADYQKQVAEQQKQADVLSAQYYPQFAPYEKSPAPFDAKSVGDKVQNQDLVAGTGAQLQKGNTYKAYYIGWNPAGKVFDSSFNGNKLKPPFDTAQGSPISGWAEGVIGMKTGGIRELTIPAALAYGAKGSGQDIPPNSPIKFIVMLIAINQ